MAKRSEVPVYLQEPEEKEERVKSLDLRQIRTLSGMWDELLYFTQGYELLFFFFLILKSLNIGGSSEAAGMLETKY